MNRKNKLKPVVKPRKKSDTSDNSDIESEDEKEYEHIETHDTPEKPYESDGEDIYPDDTYYGDDSVTDSDSAEEVDESDTEQKEYQILESNQPEELLKQRIPSSKFIEYQFRVPDEERKTSNYLSLFEATQLLSIRISMIQKQSPSMVSNDDLSYAHEIARKELFERKIPLKIKRLVGIDDKKRILYEEWDPKKMTLPDIESR